MPAKSVKQRRFFGLVYALKKGRISPSEVSEAVRKTAKGISTEEAREFAKTKEKGLPTKVSTKAIKRKQI